MLDLWTGRLTPREALNFIDRLPRNSHFMAALADDDELADELAKREDENTKAPPPPLTEFGPVEEKLTLIADRLGQLLAATAKAAGVKSAKAPPPLPRPVTAQHRARQRRRRGKHDLVMQRLAEAAAQGRPTMSDLTADATHAAAPPSGWRKKRG